MARMDSKAVTMTFGLIVFLLFGFFFVRGEETSPADESTLAQELEKEKKSDKKEKEQPQVILHNEITVTATRTEKPTFEVPNPVNVVDQEKIVENAPNSVTDLFFELPGVDVVGVGPTQSRPVIRGLRGQRILLLEDGIRLNNSRRQQNFGEIPALVDVSGVNRVEIVKGPASVLYGSDALGGVINIITGIPQYQDEGAVVHGSVGYRFSSADSQNKGNANLYGGIGKFGFMLGGSYRKANEYDAPAGTFGDIQLSEDVLVHDSGVEDNNLSVFFGFRLSEYDDISFKFENYYSKNSGFGYVDPSVYAEGDPLIQIRYPEQKMQKYILRYENRGLNFVLANGLSLTGYYLKNVRDMSMNIFIPFNIPRLPGAGVEMESNNFTDIRTSGFRFELTKVLFQKHILTYGVDFFQDSSENTDSNITQVMGFGPPVITADTTPLVPNASYRGLGIFIQDDMTLFPRSSLILGVRYQSVNAKTKATPGLEDESLYNSTDNTAVATANFSYGLTDNLRAFFSLGRGFRSPNLIERFFNGPTPEGSGFQSRNTELKAETSLNLDVGLKYRLSRLYLESSYFRNIVYDGIQVLPTGATVNEIPEYKNVNIDKLLLTGFEALGQFRFDFGLSVIANFTYITSKNLRNPELPYTNTFGSKLNFHVRYDHPRDIFYAEYAVRYNGDQKDIELANNPIGSIIPGFTVHTVKAGVTLFRESRFRQKVGVIIGNLTNTLYSEFSNASFFRPAPERHIVLTWSSQF